MENIILLSKTEDLLYTSKQLIKIRSLIKIGAAMLVDQNLLLIDSMGKASQNHVDLVVKNRGAYVISDGANFNYGEINDEVYSNFLQRLENLMMNNFNDAIMRERELCRTFENLYADVEECYLDMKKEDPEDFFDTFMKARDMFLKAKMNDDLFFSAKLSTRSFINNELMDFIRNISSQKISNKTNGFAFDKTEIKTLNKVLQSKNYGEFARKNLQNGLNNLAVQEK